ncbi:divergent polysaccharide deacetylase family protein [Helicobacter sp. MIT 21-1697]|uniref:divergent polysaccharide deacetylase family protein n=1 Tax=Helicobacter sp. MIT 21-1697 TaxID=2993733 RepID=UPI00224B52A0|nr:divergent polysaccharide deacetylase family protein [Helicobacter sp. MIT 21-1697]MCX2717118.1 divergent polysaccharide deacetylase family protein [Helicobacter sp. MIT 21-1697]
MRIWFFVLLCVCHINVWADSILTFLQDTSAPTQSAEQYISIQHPIIQGFNKAFSQIHSDNFINLDSQANSLDAPPPKQQDSQSLSTPSPAPQSVTKPKVLLIMDDLSTLAQIRHLEYLKLNITPSIFPKTKHNPSTPHLAQRVLKNGKSFMIHLPLEAQHFIQKELEPIKMGASRESIKQDILAIKNDFPQLVYLNNHTGSKFTQSKADMINLLSVFDELGLKFIDSVTTSHPASESIAREQKRLIMARDIFLDNQSDVAYTKAQLKSLMKKAQKKGYAIAICHPHPTTFRALAQMRDEINATLELISPQELESYLLAHTTYYVRSPFTP